jgi:hypothetical protein
MGDGPALLNVLETVFAPGLVAGSLRPPNPAVCRLVKIDSAQAHQDAHRDHGQSRQRHEIRMPGRQGTTLINQNFHHGVGDSRCFLMCTELFRYLGQMSNIDSYDFIIVNLLL